MWHLSLITSTTLFKIQLRNTRSSTSSYVKTFLVVTNSRVNNKFNIYWENNRTLLILQLHACCLSLPFSLEWYKGCAANMTKQTTVQVTLPTVSRHGISVLSHYLECFSSFNTHLSHSRQWFNIHLIHTYHFQITTWLPHNSPFTNSKFTKIMLHPRTVSNFNKNCMNLQLHLAQFTKIS